ncbi:tumor susceptibility gene 101 protein-like [Uloborus diversus]|uniref:tumor susceptibility gene 101 protein-like n=1 Tax=Uloborus diversus TaxID=327109 RepID=UPI00240A9B7D|nr:tumor susceptibility gene 101 protein-like [Uloborus diversus]
MPQESFDSYVGQILSKYQFPDRAKRDVCAAIREYQNLRVKLDTYVFNDGSRQELACLDGTIPVMYKGTYYHIPICIWLMDSHPYSSPMCYVKPTADMQIKASRHVDTNGRIYLPYLHNWQPDNFDLLGVIHVMIIVFGETPPVYSKPKLQNSSAYTTTPYPTEPSSFMPMPNVGTTYPPYPPVPATGPAPYPAVSSAYPSYPGNYPVASGYNYSGYNAATGGVPTTNNYPPVAATASNPLPYPQTTASNMTQQSSGTITEEHIHASLLSAVEDKLKKRLREVLAQSQAEIEVLKKTEGDLNKGKSKIEEIINRMQQEQKQLEKNVLTLSLKEGEIEELRQKIEHQANVPIDDAVVTPAPLYNQLLNAFAEENATEDAVYYLGEALRKGVIDLDIFLKHVRSLSWKQFMLKALMQKCREKANLPH